MFTDSDAYIIGLTGMSGAGKTTACEAFAQCGTDIINCDKIARVVVEKGRPALKELEACFGKKIILPDGTLDRKKIGNLIFSDEAARLRFNEIIYPFISYEMVMNAVEYIKNGSKYILLDAPTLFESGTDSFCNIIVSVVAEHEDSIKRIMRRDNLTRGEAENRLSSQHSAAFYRSKSDFCVVNNGTKEELKKKITDIFNLIGDQNEKK